MRHPTEGTLRRLLDEPAGVADADRAHVTDCPVCLAELAVAQEDATTIGSALGDEPTTDVDTDAAWVRLTTAAAAGQDRPVAAEGPAFRRRLSLRNPVVAALGVAALLTGAGAAAAADWLQIFRTEEIAPVSVTQSDLVELPDLSAYGDVQLVDEPDVRRVADAADAEDVSGLAVPTVTELPRGVTGEPTYTVGDQVSAIFTFSAEEAADAAAVAGEELPQPPEGLDGSEFRLVAGPGVAAVWSEARGIPALAVGRVVAPTAYSSSVPFETARDYLLSLPGLPENVATQLRSFSGDGTTLPLPVPAGLVETSTAEVDGAPATVLSTQDGTMAAVVWVDDGIVTAVAGSLSTDEVLSVARGLQEQ
jgi:hypothetical protein